MVVSNIKQITDQGVRVVKLERVHIYCYEMHDGLHIGLVTNLVVIVSVKKYQTDRHFIRRILMYIVIQTGLQYNAHDSGYSNKRDK